MIATIKNASIQRIGWITNNTTKNNTTNAATINQTIPLAYFPLQTTPSY